MPTDLTKARQLFGTFSKIGAFTFGGGYAMIPLIQREVTERRRWLEDRDILDIVAIAESTPGPIAINTATFVGYQVCGTLGAFCATLGVVLPSFLVIYAVSFVLRQFSDLAVVQYAFNGIRAGVLALLLKALLSMYRLSNEAMILADHFMIIMSVIMVGMSYQMPVSMGIIQSSGDTKFTLRLNLISTWLIVMPLSFLAAFVWKWPVELVVVAVQCDQIFKGLPIFLRFRSYRWIHKLTA